MAINKVVYNSKTLIDLSNDTVTQNSLLEGFKAHSKEGLAIVGAVTFNHYYVGENEPNSSLGINGDIYLRTS